MTWYADDTECDFFGPELAPYIRWVGWLNQAQNFATGKTSESVYKALEELLKNPYSPFLSAGIHICNLCQYPREAGSQTLLVPGNDLIYFCPDLILHYIGVHWYKPPELFCQAVLECPQPDSMEYKEKLINSGGQKLV